MEIEYEKHTLLPSFVDTRSRTNILLFLPLVARWEIDVSRNCGNMPDVGRNHWACVANFTLFWASEPQLTKQKK